MKVPAECPGELSKEERKKTKVDRQAATGTLLKPTPGTPDHVAELPDLTRSNTMNSLSSGYAASAHRSISGQVVNPRSPEDTTTPELPGSRPVARKPRLVAPPPTAYISELPGSSVNGSHATKTNEQKGKMLYSFEAGGDGELSASEGQEVSIVEPDGMLSILNPQYAQTLTLIHRRIWLGQSPRWAQGRNRARNISRNICRAHRTAGYRVISNSSRVYILKLGLIYRHSSASSQEKGTGRCASSRGQDAKIRHRSV